MSGDAANAVDRAVVERLHDEINRFNVEATGVRDFRELLRMQHD